MKEEKEIPQTLHIEFDFLINEKRRKEKKDVENEGEEILLTMRQINSQSRTITIYNIRTQPYS